MQSIFYALKHLVLIALLCSSGHIYSIENPLRDPTQLAIVRKEKVVQLKSAKPVLIDYELIRRDFAEVEKMSDSQIDHWLIEQVGYISKPQVKQNLVNSEIPVLANERDAYRPKNYNRALVFQTNGGALIDAKGTGSLHPSSGDHANGLASLGETIREFGYEKLVTRILRHAGSETQTVGCYGVIDLGFDIIHDDGKVARAGMVLRQAHIRAKGAYSLLDNDRALKVEKILRRYGITSAGAHRHKWKHEWLNIQGTSDGGILDFGGYLSVEKFEKPLVEAFRNIPLMSVQEVVALQPDPELRVPLEIWGSTATGKVDPAFDNPSAWSHELAESLRRGEATRDSANQHMKNLLEPVEQILNSRPQKLQIPRSPCSEAFANIINEALR